MKNINIAFQYVRLFTCVVIACCTLISIYTVYRCFAMVNSVESRIYILANGKALEAYAAGRKDNIPVEARDHVRTFHESFFSLDPDDKVIKANISKALYLADESAKKEYDNLEEKGYYANVIAGNISQTLHIDSISVNIDTYPFHFKCYGTQTMVRPTSIVTRSLVTEGYLRNVSRSDNNPHGFLIEKWSILENRDLKIDNR